eukprot:1161418-Pelagomonas_calceolata.AAC.11
MPGGLDFCMDHCSRFIPPWITGHRSFLHGPLGTVHSSMDHWSRFIPPWITGSYLLFAAQCSCQAAGLYPFTIFVQPTGYFPVKVEGILEGSVIHSRVPVYQFKMSAEMTRLDNAWSCMHFQTWV